MYEHMCNTICVGQTIYKFTLFWQLSIVKQIIDFHVCILHLFRSSRQISHLLVLHNNYDGSCAYTYRKQMSMHIMKDICIAKYIIIQICNKIILYPLQANE